MKIILSIIACANLLTAIALGADLNFKRAGTIAGKIIYEQDLMEHAEALFMENEKKIELFKNANHNFSQYLQLKQSYLRQFKAQAMKDLFFTLLTEHEAQNNNIHLDNNQPTTSYTLPEVTEQEVAEAAASIEVEILRPLTDKGKNLTDARVEFGLTLQQMAYPHYPHENILVTYNRWFEGYKKALKLRIRKQRMEQYLKSRVHLYDPSISISRASIQQFENTAINNLQQAFANKPMKRSEAIQTLKVSKYNFIVDKIILQNASEMPLASIKQHSEQAYQEEKSFILKTFITKLNREKIDRILYYESLTANFIDKYKTIEKLEEVRDTAMAKYTQEGNFQQFMLAQIYQLSIDKLQFNFSSKLSASLLTPLLHQLQATLKSDSTYLENKELLFQDIVEKEFTHIAQKNQHSDYELSFLKLASMILKFDAYQANQKAALVHIKLLDEKTRNFKIRQFLQAELFTQRLERYKQEELPILADNYFLSINLDDGQVLKGPKAIQFLNL